MEGGLTSVEFLLSFRPPSDNFDAPSGVNESGSCESDERNGSEQHNKCELVGCVKKVRACA